MLRSWCIYGEETYLREDLLISRKNLFGDRLIVKQLLCRKQVESLVDAATVKS